MYSYTISSLIVFLKYASYFILENQPEAHDQSFSSVTKITSNVIYS